jgi:hypothetical protein
MGNFLDWCSVLFLFHDLYDCLVHSYWVKVSGLVEVFAYEIAAVKTRSPFVHIDSLHGISLAYLAA